MVSGYHVVMFLVGVISDDGWPTLTGSKQVYLIGYLVTYTYASSSTADEVINKIRTFIANKYSNYANHFSLCGTRLGDLHRFPGC